MLARDPKITVTVFYDQWSKRTSKEFTDIYQARRFYVAKDREGKRPALHAESEEIARNPNLKGS